MSHILRHCSALYRYPFTNIGRFPLVRVLSSSKSATVATVNRYQSRPGSNGSWGRDTRGEAGMPERFPLHGKTIDGKTFPMGADVVLENAESSAEAVLRDVDEDGILYRSGLRDEDILERANAIPVRGVNLKNLVDAIGKLNAFYFVLRRRSLCRDNSYIHINFNAEIEDSDSPDCDERTNNVEREQVTTRQMAYLSRVSQRKETCELVEFRTPYLAVETLILGVPHYLNTDANDSHVQFTQNPAGFDPLYVGQNGIVLRLAANSKKCLQADTDHNLSIGETGNLVNITEPDKRIFLMEPEHPRIPLYKLKGSESPDYYLNYYKDEEDRYIGEMKRYGVKFRYLPTCLDDAEREVKGEKP